MVVYEFYRLDSTKGYKLIGILPEKRKRPERITQESIMRWGENTFGKELDAKDIYFIQVTLNEISIKDYSYTLEAPPADLRKLSEKRFYK